jgi:hypothetical protein
MVIPCGEGCAGSAEKGTFLFLAGNFFTSDAPDSNGNDATAPEQYAQSV